MKLNYLIQEIKSIITESINISENDYPFIKYFTFSKYKRKFEKGFEFKIKIYILNSYYLNQGNSENIQYLSLLIPFTLYMINRHSYIKERCK